MPSSIKLFSVFGIAVRMHLTFPLILIWGALRFGPFNNQGVEGAVFGVVVTLLLFAVVLLHELGHSLAALRYAVPVRQIILLPIGGVAELERIPENPRQEFVIAIAGPAVNFALALVMLGVRAVTGPVLDLGRVNTIVDTMGTLTFQSIFDFVFIANLGLGIFNLIPAYPMDGGRVLRALLALRIPYTRATRIAVTIGRGLAWILGWWGFINGDLFLILIAVFIYMGAGQEGQMVQLRHALGNLTVRQAYSRHARTLAPHNSLRDAIQLTLTTFQSDFPVCDGDRLVGLLTYAQLLDALNKRSPDAPVSTVMATDVQPVTPDDGLFDVQQRLSAENLGALPVVADGHFVGLLTARDINEAYRLNAMQPELLALKT